MHSEDLAPRTACAPAPGAHLLQFVSLYDRGRGVSIPCDEAGNVDMNTLTERLRIAYLGARAMVGREYAFPTVQVARLGPDRREPTLQPCAAEALASL